MQQIGRLRGTRWRSGSATFAAQGIRPALGGVAVEPRFDLGQRRVEELLHRHGRHGACTRIAAVPDDVKNDVFVSGIDVVAVPAPATGCQINLDVARPGRILSDLDDRVVKIGTGFAIPESRMKHAHRLAVEGLEFIAQEALMIPHSLEQAFGRIGRPLFQEREARLVLSVPGGIEV